MTYRCLPARLRMPQIYCAPSSGCRHRLLLICPRASHLPRAYRGVHTQKLLVNKTRSIGNIGVDTLLFSKWERAPCCREATPEDRTSGWKPQDPYILLCTTKPLIFGLCLLTRYCSAWFSKHTVAFMHLMSVVLSGGFHKCAWYPLFWQVLESGIRIGVRAALIRGFILCCFSHPSD